MIISGRPHLHWDLILIEILDVVPQPDETVRRWNFLWGLVKGWIHFAFKRNVNNLWAEATLLWCFKTWPQILWYSSNKRWGIFPLPLDLGRMIFITNKIKQRMIYDFLGYVIKWHATLALFIEMFYLGNVSFYVCRLAQIMCLCCEKAQVTWNLQRQSQCRNFSWQPQLSLAFVFF